MNTRTICACCFVLATAGSTLHAQRLHQGFWIGFAPGGVGIAGGEGFAYPLYLRLGGTITQRVLVGVESFSAIVDADPPVFSGNVTLLALLYPFPKRGLFAKGGFGLARATARCPDSPDDALHGVGVTIGLGYDIRLGTNIYLTPGVDLLLRTNERPLCPVPGQPQAGVARDFSPGYFFTLGLTWH